MLVSVFKVKIKTTVETKEITIKPCPLYQANKMFLREPAILILDIIIAPENSTQVTSSEQRPNNWRIELAFKFL